MKQGVKAVFVAAVLAVQSFGAVGTLAEMRTSGGFTPRPMPPYGTRILTDGTVVAFRGAETREVAKIAEDRLAVLEAKANALDPNEKLVMPEGPMCADAPTTNYEMVNAEGKRIAIGKRANCKDYTLPSGMGYDVRRVLEGLNALGTLRAPTR